MIPLDEIEQMTDEQAKLYLARAGISPLDLDAMWRDSCQEWANDPDPDVADLGRALLEREPKK